MRIYHQCGHYMRWNIDSFQSDQVGDGLIISPLNCKAERVEALPVGIRRCSIFDPQFYLPKSQKGKLATYPFFPATRCEGLATSDLEKIMEHCAEECVRFQVDSDFEYVVIPTRYLDALPSNYLQQLDEQIVNPFLEAVRAVGSDKPVLLTVIAKAIQVTDSDQRDALLNWITGKDDIDGVYLILENARLTKQIKDADFLAGALKIIHALKLNDLRVVVGYNSTEGILYSIAGPDAVAMGCFENLRAFSSRRFDTTRIHSRSPQPRLYSPKLLQWIEYAYIEALRERYSGWESLFGESPYTSLMFRPDFAWNSRRPELYRHYFFVFSDQVRTLADPLSERQRQVEAMVDEALGFFDTIQQAGIYPDEDSDGSHLPPWIGAMENYNRHLKELGL